MHTYERINVFARFCGNLRDDVTEGCIMVSNNIGILKTAGVISNHNWKKKRMEKNKHEDISQNCEDLFKKSKVIFRMKICHTSGGGDYLSSLIWLIFQNCIYYESFSSSNMS